MYSINIMYGLNWKIQIFVSIAEKKALFLRSLLTLYQCVPTFCSRRANLNFHKNTGGHKKK